MKSISCILFAAVMALNLGAQQVPRQSAPSVKKQLTAKPAEPPAPKTPVDGVIDMVNSKIGDAVILNVVRNQKITFSMDDIIRLHKAGASPALLEALARGGNSEPAPQPVAVPQPNQPPPPPPVNAAPSLPPVDLNALTCDAPKEQRKRVLAVQEFDFGAVKTKEQTVYNTEVAIGKGMAALAIKRISEGGKFRVVERAMLNKVLQEQDTNASTRVKQGTGARTGRVIGADAMLIGTIVVFGPDDKHTGIGGWMGKIWGPLGKLKLKFGTSKFVVAVNYRLVDAETSEVIGEGEARGEAERKSKGVDLGAIFSGAAAGGSIDMTSSNFLETIVGEASMAAMTKLINGLNEREAKVPLHFIDATSRVASVDGAKAHISAGSINGILPCDRFTVSRIEKEIIDPVTKEVLDLQTRKIGEMVVTEVKEKSSSGFFQGTEMPKITDVVEKIKPAAPVADAPPANPLAAPAPQQGASK